MEHPAAFVFQVMLAAPKLASHPWVRCPALSCQRAQGRTGRSRDGTAVSAPVTCTLQGTMCATSPQGPAPRWGQEAIPPATLGLRWTFQTGVSPLTGMGDLGAPRGPGLGPPASFRVPAAASRGLPELPFLSWERKSPPCTSSYASSTLN